MRGIRPTVQVCLGFLLTTLTIQLIPPMAARVGWEWAFAVLAVGPLLGIAALRRLPNAAAELAARAAGTAR